jgi:hypothetical protein
LVFDVQGIKTDLADIRHKIGIRSNQDLLRWISPLNVTYWSSFRKALKKIWPGTGTWLLSTYQYLRWVEKGGSLCIHGPAGSGKTVMSAFAIDHLSTAAALCEGTGARVLYYYFENADNWKNKVAGLYDSLIRQLFMLEDDALGYDEILALEIQTRGCQPSVDQRLQLLRKLLCKATTYSTVYLVIDACDECTDFLTDHNVHFLKDLVARSRGKLPQSDISNKENHGDLRIILTTRNYLALQSLGLASEDLNLSLFKNDGVCKDIRKLVEGKIHAMGPSAVSAMTRAGLLRAAVKTIADKSDGL